MMPASQTTIDRVSRNVATDLDVARLSSSSTADNELKYNLFMKENFALHSMHNRFPLGSSFELDSSYMQPVINAMEEAVNLVSLDLLDGLDTASIQGALVEFGVAQGGWLGPILNHMDATGRTRDVVGFDSFEGLSEPNTTFDYPFWYKGEFAFSLETASTYLKSAERPHLRLIKGWVDETLKQPIASSISKIAFAKIDVDLYEPTVDCLNYLTGKLVAREQFDFWLQRVSWGSHRAFVVSLTSKASTKMKA